MIDALRARLEQLLGRGSAAVTVPPLDGALKPNNRLEDAPQAFTLDEPDNILGSGQHLWCSSGATLYRLPAEPGAGPVAVGTSGSAITAGAVSPGARLALACDAEGITLLEGATRVARFAQLDGAPLGCITAMCFADERTLLACVGSRAHPITQWQTDLLSGGHSGSVLRIDTETGAVTTLARGLAFPYGIAMLADGGMIVSESWRKQLIALDPNGRRRGPLIEDLPGYPARIAPSGRGGYWLSVFAPRSQLIEFVLREPVYRRAMMAQVDPRYWVAPALRSGASFREPMQGGALKQMGILKPWAPTRSYGLVLELDAAFEPVRSMHSRAGGRHHGVTGVVEHGGRLWVCCRGGDAIATIDLSAEGAR